MPLLPLHPSTSSVDTSSIVFLASRYTTLLLILLLALPPLSSPSPASLSSSQVGRALSYDHQNSLSGLYLHGQSIVYLDEKGAKSSFCDVDRCSIFNSPLSTFFHNTNASSTRLPVKYHPYPNSIHACIDICQSLDQVITKNSDTLLIFTTCNHLSISIRSLQSLSSHKSTDSYDIVVIDDHSIDGTSSYLKKNGYFVIEKEQPLGLTHSWNIGYRVAKYLKYRYIIFANNDILVPHGAIDICRRSLLTEALVVPMTTKKGAGHNPSQSISLIHSLNAYQNQFVNNPANFQLVQNLLDQLRAKGEYKTLEKSVWNNKLKFNGFFFAVNSELIAPAAYDEENLFDPGNIMVSQEDTLMHSMESHRLYPMITRYAFVYHFKSVTVKVANHVSGSKNETRNNLQHYHPELDSNMTPLDFPQLYISYSSSLQSTEMELYPRFIEKKIVVAFIIPSKIKFASASDLETVQAFDHSLRKFFNVEVKVIGKTGSWYDVDGVDVVVSLYDLLQFPEVVNAKPTMISIAWLRTNYFRWVSASNLGAYDMILLPSEGSLNHFRSIFGNGGLPVQCYLRCPPFMRHVQQRSSTLVDVLRNAADSRITSKELPWEDRKEFMVDYLLLVNTPVADFNLSVFNVEGYKGAVLMGRKWKHLLSRGDGTVISSIDMMSRVLQSTRLVLEHVNDDLFPYTSLSHNCLNALASGRPVLTNAKVGALDPLAKKLQIYSTLGEMKKMVRNVLEAKPSKQTLSLQQEILSKHTFDQRVEYFNNLLQRNFNVSLPRFQTLNPPSSESAIGDQSRCYCLIIRVKEASREMLQTFVKNLLHQYSQLPQILRQGFKYRLYVLKPHFISPEMTALFMEFINDAMKHAEVGSYLQLFYDPSLTTKTRRSIDGTDDIDHLLNQLERESTCDWMTITDAISYHYHADWLTTIAPSIVGEQNTLITWNYYANYSSALTADITLNPSDPSTPLHERLLLGGMAFNSLSVKNRLPSFMYFDSRLSLSILERRVVRSILQATGTLHHSHYPTALMTSTQGDSSNTENEDKNLRNPGAGFFRIPFW